MTALCTFGSCFRACAIVFALVLPPSLASANAFEIAGKVSDITGRPVAGALAELVDADGDTRTQAISDAGGNFRLDATTPGVYQIVVRLPGFQPAARTLLLSTSDAQYHVNFRLNIGASESVLVTSDMSQVDLFSPDPSEKVLFHQDLLDANPGRPGAPVSIPGLPIETASGGIKAPQYFAPGVAGDHGEPIAQFVAVGGYLLPNNLSANAHGNGYADPNILIPAVLADVVVDGGAFNVLEGNHAVNLAATYGLRANLDPFLTLAGDYRDIDLTAGFSPGSQSWLAVEGSWGNGFLKRLEHRQQYKLNAERNFEARNHRLSFLGIAYYGSSYIPGLVPLTLTAPQAAASLNAGDTIDPRQKDQTHTALIALNDEWTMSGQQQFELSGFFRTYNLALDSDFGQGLIRQSEFRTVAGASAGYANRFNQKLSFLSGIDFEREAPRRDDLDHYNFYAAGDRSYGPFTKVAAANVTITPVTPYAAFQGVAGTHLRYYAGWRRDEIDFENRDLLEPRNSFQQWVGVNSPKVTLSGIPGPLKWAPLLSGSFGESFFTEDPRIGSGVARATPVSRAHSYELVAGKTVAHTEMKLTLGHVTTAEELAKIDPDTGLQENLGPGRLRFLTAALRQSFAAGSLLVTFSKADARDILSGQPTPEAPRTIFDVVGIAEKLPFHLRAKGEFEYVGAKPLGTGCNPDPNAQCVGVPVKEFRLAVSRSFQEGRFSLGADLLAATGYTGQTLENFYPSVVSQPAGVRIVPYAAASFNYTFGARAGP